MIRLIPVLACALILTASALSRESVAESGIAPIRLASEKKAESGGSEARGARHDIEIVRIKPIIFQIPGPGGLRRSIGVTVLLELAKASYRDRVVSKLPKIKARIFEAWTARALVSSGDENFDPEEIKRRAQHASDVLFGADIVSGVLIESISEVLIR